MKYTKNTDLEYQHEHTSAADDDGGQLQYSVEN